jgi:hypothetical protein
VLCCLQWCSVLCCLLWCSVVCCLLWCSVLCCLLWCSAHKRYSVGLYYFLFRRRFMFCYVMLYLFKHTGVQHDFYIRWCSNRSTITRRMSLVVHELFRSTWVYPRFLNGFMLCCSIFSFLCSVLRPLFVIFLLVAVLSVLFSIFNPDSRY